MMKCSQATAPTSNLGVFKDNKRRPFHRWYPFIEGYSSELVEQAIGAGDISGVVFDPFGGSGTTSLTASMLGVNSYFTEVNPYMAWIADVKVNQSRELYNSNSGTRELRKALLETANPKLPSIDRDHPLVAASARRGYFPEGVAEQSVGLLEAINANMTGPSAQIAHLAVAASLVPASNMIRRTDLRKRTPTDVRPIALLEAVQMRLREFVDDIEKEGQRLQGRATRLAADVRQRWKSPEDISVVITSPPYLNGTNYCRNTKLELLALGFIKNEQQLRELRLESISAGINNVSGRRDVPLSIPVWRRLQKNLMQWPTTSVFRDWSGGTFLTCIRRSPEYETT